MTIGKTELIIVASILAILFFLIKFGGRAAVMKLLGGFCLMFVGGMVVVLALSDDDGPIRNWLGFSVIEMPFVLPQSIQKTAEAERGIDSPVAGTASASGDTRRSSSASTPSTEDTSRPAWVDERTGGEVGGVYAVTASAERYKTMNEAAEEIAVKIRDETDDYVNRLFGETDAAAQVGLSSQFIMEQVVTDDWQEVVEHEEFGPMINLHVRLRFDDEVLATINDRYRQAMAREKLMTLGLAAGIVLLLVISSISLAGKMFLRGHYSDHR